MDMPNLPKGLDSKKLAIIAVAGVGAGLLWRHFSNKSAASGTAPDETGLADSSTGNLAAGSGSNGGIEDSGTTRDIGSINLPVVGWVVTIGGVQYWTDGTNLYPLSNSGGNTDTTVPVVPGGKPSQGVPRYGPTGPFIPDYNADVTNVSSTPIDFGLRSNKVTGATGGFVPGNN